MGTIITQGISIGNASVVEGNSPDQTAMLFTVSLSCAFDQDVTVAYSTGSSSDTATAGSDYTATSGTLTFAGGTTQSQVVTVMVTGDDVKEGNETFSVNLSDATVAPHLYSPRHGHHSGRRRLQSLLRDATDGYERRPAADRRHARRGR